MNYLKKVMISAVMVFMLGGVIAIAQTPQLCTENNFEAGIVRLDVAFSDTIGMADDGSNFNGNVAYTAALLGTIEGVGGNVLAGMDWFTPTVYDGSDAVEANGETNVYGSSLVGWWTRNDGRNTLIQVTNTARDTNDQDPLNPANPLDGAITVHVEIRNAACNEIVNFCDTYTPADTHIYDFSNLVSNRGQAIDLINTGEGIITITASNDTCDAFTNTHPAVSYNFLQGNMQIVTDDYQYGANMRARRSNLDIREIIEGPAVDNPDNAEYDFYDDSLDNDMDRVSEFLRDFNSAGTVASDVVLMGFADTFDADTPPNYTIGAPAANANFDASATDVAEGPVSCDGVSGCFARVALSPAFPGSDETPIDPEEDCDTAGDEDDNGAADCADAACDGMMGPSGETCENPSELTCDDAADNDGDGAVDLDDADCQEGGAGGGACDDGEDNDGDELVDCDDPGCAADPVCDTGGDGDGDGDGDGGGDGCSVVGTSTSSGAAVNFLLPMMVFGLGIMLRRMRRK